jgi:hypothetical protein
MVRVETDMSAQMGHVRFPDTGSEGAPPREKRALLGGTGLENPIRLYSLVWFGSVLPVLLGF